MMRAVLADMALEVEGAARVGDAALPLLRSAHRRQREAARARLLTPAIKYWVCKTAPALLYEAMECLGGNGYVEDGVLARLYREAPVNAIWEGSGNVMGLDVLRAMARDRGRQRAVLAELVREAKDLSGRDANCCGLDENSRQSFSGIRCARSGRAIGADRFGRRLADQRTGRHRRGVRPHTTR